MDMQYFLIDFENVQCKNVGALTPGACRIVVFLGANQSKLMLELVQALQPFGADVEYVQIAGNGPNALDFHIAFYVGRLSMQFPAARFTILSADTGFDPLIRHLAGKNIRCNRTAIIPTGAARSTHVAKKTVAPTVAIPKAAAKAPLAKNVSLVVDAELAKTPGTPPKDSTTKARVDEVIVRLKGLKAAKPARLATLKSSIKSWFKPKLDQKQLDAVIQSLADGKKIKVDGAKVTYKLG